MTSMVLMMAHVYLACCPFCGVTNEFASNLSGSPTPPADGDVSLCAGCGQFGVFDAESDGRMRTPTDDELAAIRADDRCRQVRAAWSRLMH